MSRLHALNLRPGPQTLRQFGVAALFGFGLLAWLAFAERGVFAWGLGSARVPLAAGLLVLGVLSTVFSLVYPGGNRPLFVGLSVLTFPIGVVISYALFTLVFAVAIGLTAVVQRALGKDPLERGWDPARKSYWTPAARPRPRERYFRQF